MSNDKIEIKRQLIIRDIQSLEDKLFSLEERYDNSHYSSDLIVLITEMNLTVEYIEHLDNKLSQLTN